MELRQRVPQTELRNPAGTVFYLSSFCAQRIRASGFPNSFTLTTPYFVDSFSTGFFQLSPPPGIFHFFFFAGGASSLFTNIWASWSRALIFYSSPVHSGSELGSSPAPLSLCLSHEPNHGIQLNSLQRPWCHLPLPNLGSYRLTLGCPQKFSTPFYTAGKGVCFPTVCPCPKSCFSWSSSTVFSASH